MMAPARALLGRAAVLGVGYYLSAVLVLGYLSPGGEIALFWPANAIAVALLVTGPSRDQPVLLAVAGAACLLGRLPLGDLPLLASLGWVVAHLIEIFVIAEAVRRLAPGPVDAASLPRVVPTALLAAVPATMAGAVVGAAAMVAGLPDASSTHAYLVWFTGDLSGIALVLPAILGCCVSGRPRGAWAFRRRVVLEGAAVVAAVVLIGAVMWRELSAEASLSLMVPFLAFPVLAWLAMRVGLRGAALGVLCLGAVEVAASVLGNGPFTPDGPTAAAEAVLSKISMITIAMTAVILAAVVARRARAEAALKNESRMIQLMNRIAVSANESASVRDTLKQVLVEVGEYTGSSLGHAYLVDPEDGWRLLPTGLWCIAGESEAFEPFMAATEARAFDAGEGLPGRVLATGEPEWIDDLTSDSRYPRGATARASGLTVGFAVPVRAEGRIAGVLEFFGPRAVVPDDSLLAGLAHACTQVGRVIERQRVEEDRRRALIEAERANQAKSEFLATMSHEFRTPLNAIIGFSDILCGEYFGPLGVSRYKEYAEDIHASSEHLLVLVNDILDLAAIESGKVSLEMETFEVGAVVDDAARLIREAAIRKRITFRISVEQHDAPILANRRALKQILLNLATNAVKFTPEGGEVELSTFTQGRWYRFVVSDNGAGIPDDLMPKLTRPFTRARGNPHLSQDGSGLGLAIVRSLVEAHDGELAFESAPGEGTRVIVSLARAFGMDVPGDQRNNRLA